MADGSIRINSDGTTNIGGITVNTPYDDDQSLVSVDDFLQLMIAQMKNQDFLSEGGGDNNTQYISQLAQISTMQEMKQLAYYSKTNYVMGLIGKDVTAATLGIGGRVTKEVGPVEKVIFDGEDFLIYVNGKGFRMKEIMTVNNPGIVTDESLDKLSKSAVLLMDRSDTTASVRWLGPVTDDLTVLDKLEYDVYYSTDGNKMNSVEDIKKGQKVGTVKGTSGYDDDDTSGKTSREYTLKAEGLEPDTQYYINVVARTPDGKEYSYQKLSFKTKS